MNVLKVPWGGTLLDGEGRFEGYGSVFGVIDSQGEVLERGAFKDTLKEWKQKGSLPKMLWQHDPTQVIGVWQEVEEDDYGLKVKGRLLLEVLKGAEAYTLLKNGAIEGLSVGFQTKRSYVDRLKKVRYLKEVCLLEISLVTFASNPMAKVLESKGLKERLDSLADRLRAF